MRKHIISYFLLLTIIACATDAASADKLCTKFTLSRGKIAVAKRTVASTARCPRGYSAFIDTASLTGATGTAGAAGATGASGATGADGALKVWGDGSAGAGAFATGASTLSNGNYQFTDFTVGAGASLSIRSGATVRATGTCTIDGAISVSTSSAGGMIRVPAGAGIISFSVLPGIQGLSYTSASEGEYGSSAVNVGGGIGGSALLITESINLLKSVLHPGAGGGPAYGGFSGSGGGGIALYCKNGVVIGSGGTVNADGSASSNSGGGGGAGGLIIIASTVSVVNSGAVQARGGNGGPSSAAIGAGGGGGGGVVNFVAPVVTAGTISVTGGTAGNNVLNVSTTPRFGGSSGGSFGGSGGSGGSVSTANATTGSAGTDGKANTIIADPTALLL